MNHKERMLNELPYKAWMDGLEEERMLCREKIYEYNHLHPREHQKLPEMMKELLGKTGETVNIVPPFHCDYGYNIEVGENFFANYNFLVLDVGKVLIGDNVQVAPNVAIYTAGHPLHAEMRNTGYEYGINVTIGDNVWIGGNTVILPGVTIGDNVVIGAGSVVGKDVPANMIAVGNPLRIIREITEEDRPYYYKDRTYDEESWNEIQEMLKK
ncbi:sugar O-acetyltransferase [Proteiniclasticum sp. SCR006]|uniref:Acetyltransferase n=1 Tax=Proteiniclasticum aestuarii TaxID=2817862 RepID=A0A939KFN0_9CLOT|nr:sugar O-acetyltransferase [Proteiniclasticum aestuarii]MBO1264627.1 sugar O-acetyltransferase [Proteiniclasticum aestuarii]